MTKTVVLLAAALLAAGCAQEKTTYGDARGVKAAFLQPGRQLPPPGLRQLERHRLRVLVAEHSDPVDALGLVERVLAVAESAGRGVHRHALAIGDEPAVAVRMQPPAELRVALIPLRCAVADEAQRRLEDQECSDQRGERRAAHGLLQSSAAMRSAASACPASFQWPKPCFVFGKPCRNTCFSSAA